MLHLCRGEAAAPQSCAAGANPGCASGAEAVGAGRGRGTVASSRWQSTGHVCTVRDEHPRCCAEQPRLPRAGEAAEAKVGGWHPEHRPQ